MRFILPKRILLPYMALSFLILATPLLLISSPTYSADEIDPEWPCIQAYVPEVAIAVIWPEPVEEDVYDVWRNDAKLKNFVLEFGQLEQFENTDRDRLASFAESIPEADRIATLNAAAAGIVNQFNARRSDYFKGIRKFTRQQIAMAKKIEEHLNELVVLSNRNDEESKKRVLDIEETTAWQQRIFDKRERTIGLLCETPVELESLLGDIVRDLAQFLP